MAALLRVVNPEVGMISPRTRERMVATLRAAGIENERVLTAMAQVPRHLFVAEALASRAYEPVSLPIGWGQTISQPLIVARMLAALLDSGEPQRVLEIGTGSAYQTALFAALGMEVFSIERVEGLHIAAKELLQRLQIPTVHLRLGDGSCGWEELAPFNAVVFTAAVPCALPPLFHQLVPGGCLLMPQADVADEQRLKLYRWNGQDAEEEDLGGCRFVPLLSGTVNQKDHIGA
ncbi:protein-L-isoaspartate(D-aspartate) O-methyltransferase [Acidithiobacillus sp. IBUN Pt1247-S3]|uniref:protein-L-isoaspartate(D-aspartate) O-methyltransferase n=1 Tax=Acidithiobacillus sp. IBUN Pt1247-S3 TaxID=3166642 RepID=UPI0034E5F234